jgi:hypothetical protein
VPSREREMGMRSTVLRPMTALGQSRHFDRPPVTSGLPQLTDIPRPAQLVRFVPILLQKSFLGGE